MDILVEGFQEFGFSISWPEILDIYHQYAENLGYTPDYEEMIYEEPDCINQETMKKITPQMVEQWCWVFFTWLHFHYHGVPVKWENAPLRLDDWEQEQLFIMYMADILYRIWVHDTQREMFPEELISLQNFCTEFRLNTGR